MIITYKERISCPAVLDTFPSKTRLLCTHKFQQTQLYQTSVQ